MKVSFEMNQEDFENLTSIIHDYIVKHKYESQLEEGYSKIEKDYRVKHADYVQTDILDKIIQGRHK